MLVYLQMIESEEDKLKFEYIYENFEKLMYYVAYQVLHNSHDAEDAVQYAFVAIARNIKTVRSENYAELRAFVSLVVERKALDLIAANTRYVPIDVEDSQYGYEIPLPGDNGLQDSLAKLPAKYRQLILLRYGQGYTTKEIAKWMGIKQDSVQKLLKRAKAKLAEQLEKDESIV